MKENYFLQQKPKQSFIRLGSNDVCDEDGGENEVDSFDASFSARAGSRNCRNATFRPPRGVFIFESFVVFRRSPGTPKFDEGICDAIGEDDSKQT